MKSQNAAHMETHEEYTVGTEDRVFRSDDGWYFQIRGSADAFGPHETHEEAETAYFALSAD